MSFWGKKILTKDAKSMVIENVGMHRRPAGVTGKAREPHQTSHGPVVQIDEIFANQRLYDAVLTFSTRVYNEENVLFLKAVQFGYAHRVTYIMQIFVYAHSPKMINISGDCRRNLVDAYNLEFGGVDTQQPLGAFNTGKAFKIRGKNFDSAMRDAVGEVTMVVTGDVLANFTKSEEYRVYLQG